MVEGAKMVDKWILEGMAVYMRKYLYDAIMEGKKLNLFNIVRSIVACYVICSQKEEYGCNVGSVLEDCLEKGD